MNVFFVWISHFLQVLSPNGRLSVVLRQHNFHSSEYQILSGLFYMILDHLFSGLIFPDSILYNTENLLGEIMYFLK